MISKAFVFVRWGPHSIVASTGVRSFRFDTNELKFPIFLYCKDCIFINSCVMRAVQSQLARPPVSGLDVNRYDYYYLNSNVILLDHVLYIITCIL